MRFAFAILLSLATGGCMKQCNADPDKCEQACRNYAQLVFWETADVEINAAPADQRDALRKSKLAEFTKNMELGLPTCTSKCVSANNDTDMNCMLEAKSAKQVKACVED